MPDAAAFLATILDAPADDGPRLVYADWLEERGDTARAEFIRVQCRIPQLLAVAERWARTPSDQPGGTIGDGGAAGAALAEAQQLQGRSRALLCAHIGGWLKPLEAAIDRPTVALIDDESEPNIRLVSVRYRRGFIGAVHACAADLTRHAAAILAAHPVAEFRSTDTGHVFSIERSPGGWVAATVALDAGDGPAWFWRTREAMLAGLSRLLRAWFLIPLNRAVYEQTMPWGGSRSTPLADLALLERGAPRRPAARPFLGPAMVRMGAEIRDIVRRAVAGAVGSEVGAPAAPPQTYDNTEPREPVGAADIDRAIAETAAANALPSASFTAEFRAEDVTITPAGAAFFAGLAERGSLVTLPPGVEVVTPPQQAQPTTLLVPPGVDLDTALRVLATDPPACPVCGGRAEPEVERQTPEPPLVRVTVAWRCPACASDR